MVFEIDCYICGKKVKRHEYTHHVASHPPKSFVEYDRKLAARYGYPGDVGAQFPAHSASPHSEARTSRERAHSTSNDQPWSSDEEDSVPQRPPAQHAHIPPSHASIRHTAASDRVPHRETPRRGPTESNAFHIWRKNYVPGDDTPKYTTIDGQKHDSELPVLRDVSDVQRTTTKQEVVRIVERFKGFRSPAEQETCLELVRKTPIFPGLVAYTYTHLTTCQRSSWLGWSRNNDWSDQVSKLKRLVKWWSGYDDIWCILSCNTIKEELAKILDATKVEPKDHRCNSSLLNGTMVLSCDIRDLAALAALCVTGSRKEDILNQRGARAEMLVELFHDLHESDVGLQQNYRRHFLNALIPISKQSGYYPRSIYIAEGTISSLVSRSRGGFGVVYKGELGSRFVAVKTLLRKDTTSLPDYIEQVSREAIVWRYLRHPNCLPFYGIYDMAMQGQNSSRALVSPWMDQGTLLEYLERHREASRTKLILDVVRGLNYLHTMKPHVAHRDIKPQNILITSKGNACLADFGLVSTFDTTDNLHTVASEVHMGGTHNYMAPEIFNAGYGGDPRTVNKRACDMYALGCTIYATYTGKAPFEGIHPDQLPVRVISNQRPKFPVDKIPPDMWSFVENLWDSEPFERLTAEMALNWMEKKASYEDIDPKPGSLDEEEWKWKGQPDNKSLWSVPL